MVRGVVTILNFKDPLKKFLRTYPKAKNSIMIIAEKLNNPKTSRKTYWAIMKAFYNGKKIPLIPPLLITYKLESDFGKKANHFHEFFASKCTPLNNGSTLPHSLSNTPTVELSTFQFNEQDILKIIMALHVNKAHCDIMIMMIFQFV